MKRDIQVLSASIVITITVIGLIFFAIVGGLFLFAEKSPSPMAENSCDSVTKVTTDTGKKQFICEIVLHTEDEQINFTRGGQ